MRTNKDELAQASVRAIGERIAQMQKRKASVNTERSKLHKRLDELDKEAAELNVEHLKLLREFDAVSDLP